MIISKTLNKISLIKLSFVILLIIAMGHESFSCNCDTLPLKDEVRKADIIIHASVISINRIKIENQSKDYSIIPTYLQHVTVQIKETFKGRIKFDTVSIYTGLGKGDCGYLFKQGQSYIIYCEWKRKFYDNKYFVKRKKKFLYTSICRRTRPVENKEIEKLKRLLRHSKK